jgi:hypothetical protein
MIMMEATADAIIKGIVENSADADEDSWLTLAGKKNFSLVRLSSASGHFTLSG